MLAEIRQRINRRRNLEPAPARFTRYREPSAATSTSETVGAKSFRSFSSAGSTLSPVAFLPWTPRCTVHASLWPGGCARCQPVLLVRSITHHAVGSDHYAWLGTDTSRLCGFGLRSAEPSKDPQEGFRF